MQLSPIAGTERIRILDVLRGIAIFGIFMMNLDSFTWYFALSDAQQAQLPSAPYDDVAEFFQNVFFHGKFYSIFSMLFGVGFSIYLSKATASKEVLPLFRRRLFILLLIGFIHLLFWNGDIVMLYAMLGFVLIPFRKFSNKTLLIIAGSCILLPILLYCIKWMFPVLDISGYMYAKGDALSDELQVKSLEEYRQYMQHPGFIKSLKINFVGILFRYGDLFQQSRIFKVFGMFLLGLVAGRTFFFQQLQENRQLLKKLFRYCMIVGLIFNFIYAKLDADGDSFPYGRDGLFIAISYALGIAPLAIAYVAGICLLYTGEAHTKLNVFAPAGRMALSNYILQTVIGTFLWTGFGLALPPIGPAYYTFVCIGIFILQLFFSYLWLQKFNYGPLEWLWRSGTYGKWQPMRKK
jgi:uncharacterized protein